MFIIGYSSFFALLFVFFIVTTIRGAKAHWSDEDLQGMVVLNGVLAFVFFLALVVPSSIMILGRYSQQIHDFSEIKELEAKVSLSEEKRKNLTAIIKVEFAKYPEIEKDILKDVSEMAKILFNFPQLRSNETITDAIDDILFLENDVYNLRSQLIEKQASIYKREISPWTAYVTSYESFFGEKNPLSQKSPNH